jgi:hypothetical protein
LSQTILAAARNAHRPARATTPVPPVRVTVAHPKPLSFLLHWLASPRWAGGLATGLIAALGVGLWLDIGTQPVVDRPTAPTPAPSMQGDNRSAEAPAQEARPTAPAPTQNSTPAEAPPAAAAKRQPRTEVPTPADKPEALKPQRSEPKQTPDRRAEGALRSEVDAIPSPAPRDSPSELGAALAAPNAASGAALSPDVRAAVGASAAAASPALTLLRRARSELAAGSARWDWQAPGATGMAPFDDDAQVWLLRVVQAARGRWSDVAERAGPGASDALEVRWWRDGWPHATLRIEAEGMRWIEAGGRIRYAPLDPAALQRLRSR